MAAEFIAIFTTSISLTGMMLHKRNNFMINNRKKCKKVLYYCL